MLFSFFIMLFHVKSFQHKHIPTFSNFLLFLSVSLLLASLIQEKKIVNNSRQNEQNKWMERWRDADVVDKNRLLMVTR